MISTVKSQNELIQNNSLGLEKHVKNMFQQTQQTIIQLNEDIQNQTQINDQYSWQLQQTQQQKQELIDANKNLESQLKNL